MFCLETPIDACIMKHTGIRCAVNVAVKPPLHVTQCTAPMEGVASSVRFVDVVAMEGVSKKDGAASDVEDEVLF